MKYLGNHHIARMRTQARWGGAAPKRKERAVAQCRSCKADVLWAKTSTGSIMMMDAAPTTDGVWVFVNGDRVRYVPQSERAGLTTLFTVHWATCPFADKHRREK